LNKVTVKCSTQGNERNTSMHKLSKVVALPLIISLVILSPSLIIKPAIAQNTANPSISILYPTNETSFNVSIGGVYFQLLYQTNDTLSWVGYSINGGGNVTCTGNTTDYTAFLDDGYQFDFGHPTLILYANDTAGNCALSQTVTYTVYFYPDSTQGPTKPPTNQPSTTAQTPTQTPTTVKPQVASSHPIVTASAGVGGTISPNGVFSLSYGVSQVFTVKPDNGNVIDQVLMNGTSALRGGVNRSSPYSFTVQNVTGTTTISATFAPSGDPSSIMLSYQNQLISVVVLVLSLLTLAILSYRRHRKTLS